MAEDPLDVGQRYLRVACHPVGRRMAQVVRRPVPPQRLARPGEHAQRSMVGQLPERAPQRPPQWLVRPCRDQAVHLLLVEPQPDERVRRRRERLHRPCPLADDRDQLLPGVRVGDGGSQQFAGTRSGRDPERDQRPVPVRPEPGEQLAELLIRDTPRLPPRDPGPEQPRPAARERLHRAAVRPGTAAPAPDQRERVHHRAGPGLEVEVVKVAQHRLAVRRRGDRVTAGRARLPSDPQPPAEIACLSPGRLIPLQPRRPAEPEPAQQVHPIRPQRRIRPAAPLDVLQVPGNRDHRLACRVGQPERLPRIPRLPQPASQRDDQPRHVQAQLVITHEPGP